MAIANSTLTVSELKRHVEYDATTGIFTRLNTIHGNPCRKQLTKPQRIGYIVFEVCGRKEYAHRMAWLWVYGVQPSNGIDHINGVKTDNRIQNLRDVPQQINMQNRSKVNLNRTSNLRGVRPSLNRWSARITVNRKEIHIGNFDTKEQAHAAYIATKRLLHIGCTI